MKYIRIIITAILMSVCVSYALADAPVVKQPVKKTVCIPVYSYSHGTKVLKSNKCRTMWMHSKYKGTHIQTKKQKR